MSGYHELDIPENRMKIKTGMETVAMLGLVVGSTYLSLRR